MTERDDDHFEPVYGLPEKLPAGEKILWQGEPDRAALARTVFFRRLVAIYFAAVLAIQVAGAVAAGTAMALVLRDAAGTLVMAGVALGLLTLFAHLYARTTVYTVTNRRVVIRYGLALPLVVNLPFTSIQSAVLKVDGDGSGDIALVLDRAERVGYVQMWPCVQRWSFGHPRPALRGVPEVAAAAGVLADALAADAATSVPESVPVSAPDGLRARQAA